jgi:hypothetical protein
MHFSFDADGKLKSLDTRADHNCPGHAEYLPDGKIRSADLLMTDPEDSQAVIPLLGLNSQQTSGSRPESKDRRAV